MKYTITLNGKTAEEIEDMMQQREIYEYCKRKKAMLIGIDIHRDETVYKFETDKNHRRN